MEEEKQVEDITALMVPPVSATEIVVTNATLASSTVGKKTLDGNHVAEVVPSSPLMTFYVVSRAPLALPLAPGFQPHGPLATPRALDVAETGNHVGVIPGPNAHEVQVAPPLVPFLATYRADRNERRKKKKKEVKLKKRKNRE